MHHYWKVNTSLDTLTSIMGRWAGQPPEVSSPPPTLGSFSMPGGPLVLWPPLLSVLPAPQSLAPMASPSTWSSSVCPPPQVAASPVPLSDPPVLPAHFPVIYHPQQSFLTDSSGLLTLPCSASSFLHIPLYPAQIRSLAKALSSPAPLPPSDFLGEPPPARPFLCACT